MDIIPISVFYLRYFYVFLNIGVFKNIIYFFITSLTTTKCNCDIIAKYDGY